MPLYFTKKDLYTEVDNIRKAHRVPITDVSVCIRDFLDHYIPVEVKTLPFESRYLRGILSFGVGDESDIILLNENRTSNEQNFDCTHEFMHLMLHRSQLPQTFSCSDNVQEKQNSYLEWHANEGAAQFLMPYQDFIPRFLDYFNFNRFNGYDIRDELAEFYHVTPQVIHHRIDSLNYEIWQYEQGIPFDNIQILSKAQRQKNGIIDIAYNFDCDFPYLWDSISG